LLTRPETTDPLPTRGEEASAPLARGLIALGARLGERTPGTLLVRAGGDDAVEALSRHLARCASAVGALVVCARPRAGAPLWQDVLLQLHPPTHHRGQADAAAVVSVDTLIHAAHGRSVVVIAPLPEPGSWDASIATELAAQTSPLLTVFVTAESGDAEALRPECFDVASDLDDTERDQWWSVLARSAAAEVDAVRLPDLESWWARARQGGASGESDPRQRALTVRETALLVSLSLVGRPWLTTDLGLLAGDETTLAALVRDGIVCDAAGWLTVDATCEERIAADALGAPASVLRHCADALADRAPHDAWGLAQAAGLRLRAGDVDAADALIERALAKVDDAVARAELFRRWATLVEAAPTEGKRSLQRRAAERALAVGEADEAHRWARAAATADPQDPTVTLLVGRSLVALGDLVAAEVTLRRGLTLSPGPALTALLSVELAEVAYLKGDMTTAATEATRALAEAHGNPGAQEAVLRGRNTLGKILLAEARWDEADRHFAEDALTASSQGDATAELRARLNRGIAFLSNGALEEARSIFEDVLREGERTCDFRAAAFALDNLAVVATWRHDYAEALAFSERTLKLRQRLGDRLTTARIVGNLAELRRKLGLLEHAEHAIAFGRRALGPGMPAERSAHFSFVAARVALDRGRTADAHREIARSLRDAGLAGHRKILAEAHRVSTRIALEDGDVAGARASLVLARELAATDEARAEVALLEALVARAVGEDAEALGLTALHLARGVGEEEGLLDAHALLCETYRGRGDVDAARAHLSQAVALCEQVTAGLPADVRAAFLARRDVAMLARLEAQLAADPTLGADADLGSSPRLDAPRRPSSIAPGALAATAVLIGNDPTMRGLQLAIKKVARASSTVLIRGESGTGKELVAAALHRASDRADGPMVTVNCAALVETLLLSELFGHEKGAFTGASARRRGRFELAEGGTLFLDEIGDISPKTQVALLRVLQERTFERVGGAAPIHVDVRVVCATHRDLRAMVERGEFREDLYYRLRGITLEVPPLRARLGDLPALADNLLGRIALERDEPKKILAPCALDLLASHRWPGNVRELENALRAAALFAESGVIRATHLVENVDDLRRLAQRSDPPPPPEAPGSGSSLRSVPPPPPDADDVESDDAAVDAGGDWDAPLPSGEANATAVAYAQVRQGAVTLADMKRQIERDCISRALAETRGNITKAAALLGMKRPRLSQLVKQYGLAAVSSEAQ